MIMTANTNNYLEPAYAGTSLMERDNQYLMSDFKNVFHAKQEVANKVIAAVNQAASTGGVTDTVFNGLKTETRYVVDMSDDVQKALKAGDIKLVTNKAGEAFAQLRDANGRFGTKLPIKEEIVSMGFNMVEVTTAMQTMAIQKQLDDVMDTLDEIGNNVIEIIQGLQNDRIGLFYSGLNLYRESKEIQDPEFAKFIAAQSIKALSDANAQMIQNIQSDIMYLKNKEYKYGGGKPLDKINERMMSINKCFDVIYQSSILKATIYYERNEMSAMLATIDEYGKFINSLILPNAGMLSEHDVNDRFLQNGIWETKANSFNEMAKLKDLVKTSSVYYIQSKEEKDA